jgi:hypothetical protein
MVEKAGRPSVAVGELLQVRLERDGCPCRGGNRQAQRIDAETAGDVILIGDGRRAFRISPASVISAGRRPPRIGSAMSGRSSVRGCIRLVRQS